LWIVTWIELDPGSRIAQKTRRSSRDGPGKSRRELYGFSKEAALGRISNELFETEFSEISSTRQ
jgi:hypothetical protein